MERKVIVYLAQFWCEQTGEWLNCGYYTDVKAAAKALADRDFYWVVKPIPVYG